MKNLLASSPAPAYNAASRSKGACSFSPGYSCKYGEFVCCRDIAKVDKACYDGLDVICRSLREKLAASVDKLRL